ncbi:MAG: hypothetical protein IPM57_03780 [Oligoflexia bacterium]|nr:hypothetical protein [Oligoflexia bacterium]
MKKILCSILVLSLGFAPFKVSATELVPIHGTGIKQCQILLARIVDGKKSDALAKRISSSIKPKDLKENLLNAISHGGRDSIKGADIYVTGVAIRDHKKVEEEYKNILSEKEFSDLNLNIKVISVPKGLHEKLVNITLKDIWEKMIYFLPSYARDYQRPTYGEMLSGLGLTALVEVPTVLALFKTLPPLDAAVTSIMHATLLAAFTIYQRSIANWMMRSQGQFETFSKNLFIGGTFVTNYYVFGNLTPALNYVSSNSYQDIVNAFGAAFAGFVVSQGLTNVIQTEFYSKFIQGIRGKWVELQKNQKNNDLAREAGNWVMFLPQMANAYVLSQASLGRDPILTMGPVEFNYWQVVLLGFWTAAYGVYKKPEILNPVLPKYEMFHNWLLSLKTKFKKEVEKENLLD